MRVFQDFCRMNLFRPFLLKRTFHNTMLGSKYLWVILQCTLFFRKSMKFSDITNNQLFCTYCTSCDWLYHTSKAIRRVFTMGRFKIDPLSVDFAFHKQPKWFYAFKLGGTTLLNSMSRLIWTLVDLNSLLFIVLMEFCIYQVNKLAVMFLSSDT